MECGEGKPRRIAKKSGGGELGCGAKGKGENVYVRVILWWMSVGKLEEIPSRKNVSWGIKCEREMCLQRSCFG